MTTLATATRTNTSHAVRAPFVSIHYVFAVGTATIHRIGCAHEARADQVRDLGAAAKFEVLADDWFTVAPCARRA
jgi:hypothetical protein